MKAKTLLLVLSVVVFFTASSFASNSFTGDLNSNKTIRTQIIEKLGSTEWQASSGQTADVRICFRLDDPGT
jgi:hypothetical protein